MHTILKKHVASCIFSALILLGCIGALVVLTSVIDRSLVKVREIKEHTISYENNKKEFRKEVEVLQSLNTRAQVLNSYLVTKETLPSFLSSLEAVAQRDSVVFEITSVQTPTVSDTPKLFIEASIKGTYDQIQTFLYNVEHQRVAVRLSDLFFFAEESDRAVPATTGMLPVTTTPAQKGSATPKADQWRAVVTIEVMSF